MTPTLPDRLKPILGMEYPRFSTAEMERRRAAMTGLMAQVHCDHLVFLGANRFGSSVPWLTQWPVTTEAVGVFTPGKRDALYIHYFNHLPLARRLADQADVHWGDASAIARAVAELEWRGAKRDRVAVVGPVGAEQHAALTTAFGKVPILNKAFSNLRRIKSAEEIDWMRIGAWLSDLGMASLRDNARPGMSAVPIDTGAHLCLRARTPEAVDAFHARALANGGTDDGAPGLRAATMVTYYAAFIRDPDGNRIEVMTVPAPG